MAANFMAFLSFSFVCFLSLSSILTLMNIIRPVHTIYNIMLHFGFPRLFFRTASVSYVLYNRT